MILNPDIVGDSHASASFETVKGALQNGMYVRDLSIPPTMRINFNSTHSAEPQNFSPCSERLPSLATFGKCVGSLFIIVWFPKVSVSALRFWALSRGVSRLLMIPVNNPRSR